MDADSTSLRLAVELHAGGPGMTGSLIDERGGRHVFTGWLGLLTLLEAASARLRGDLQPKA